jgi:hypothetical protein
MDDARKPAGKKKLTSAERRARTAFLKAEREARRLAREEDWKTLVVPHFGYLETDYNFQFVGVDGANWWGTFVRYQSHLLQVEIDASIEFQGLEVELFRLEDGQVPKDLYFSETVNRINFLTALEDRAPAAYEQLRAQRGLSDEQVNSTLAMFAEALRTYFDDVLRGNLTIFDEATERRRQHALERLRQKEQEQAQEDGIAQPNDETPSEPS